MTHWWRKKKIVIQNIQMCAILVNNFQFRFFLNLHKIRHFYEVCTTDSSDCVYYDEERLPTCVLANLCKIHLIPRHQPTALRQSAVTLL